MGFGSVRPAGAARWRLSERRTSNAKIRQAMTFAAFNVSAAAFLAVVASQASGRLELVLVSLGTACLGFAAFMYAWRWAPGLAAPRFVAMIGAMQPAWMAAYVAFGGTTFAVGSEFGVDLAIHPYRSSLPFVLPGIAAALYSRLSHRGAPGRLERRIGDAPVATLEIRNLAYVSGALMLVFWWASREEATGIWYFLRIVHYSLAFTPILIGRFARGLPERVWWGCVAVNGVISLAQGARLPALFPIVLWTVGRLWRDWAKLKLFRILPFVAVGFGLLAISGLVGIAREEIGRRTFEELGGGDVKRMGTAAIAAGRGEAGSEGPVAEALKRNITWANPAAFILSPEAVPFRGVEGLSDEFMQLLRVSYMQGESRKMVLERGLGTAPAQAYGFMVTERTSVEFPALADGWSRAGWWGAFLVCFAWVWWASLFERLARRLAPARPFLGLMLFAFSLKATMDPGAVPLLSAVRGAMLYGLVTWAIATVLSLGTGRPIRRERSPVVS